MFQDRPYQDDAISADIAEYDKGTRRMLNVMATGTGKTIVFSRLYEKLKSRLPGQMLVLAHTEELVKQNATKVQEVNPGLKVGIEMAGDYVDESNTDIISGSVQTLGRKGSSRAARINWERVDKVIVDEAHHSVSDAYGRVFELARSLHPETHKILLGTTATSQRPDGKALSDIYEKVAFVYSLRQAITDKWLVPIRGFRVSTTTVLDSVESNGGDFALSALSKAVDTPDRNRSIVNHWKQLAGERKTVVFCADIEHAKHLAGEFRAEGITSDAVWGDDVGREEKLKGHQNGKFQVLCNCAVLVEGYDDPSISCVVLARPTKSPVLFAQMVGRGTRLAHGKSDLVVIDVVDSTISNTLITLPTLMGLSNILDVKGRDIVEVVEQMEAVQLEHPSLDLTTLDDIEKLESVVNSINMFEVRFPKEVEASSDFIWFKAADGGYRINIPKDGPEKAGYLRIEENMLGQWGITGQIKEVDLVATRPTMEEAFRASDEQIRKRLGKMRLQYLLREATWHSKPVTKGQRSMLERLFPWKRFPYEQMTSGMASKIINERLNKAQQK
jgi:superfamily II DNA or RNA helicase